MFIFRVTVVLYFVKTTLSVCMLKNATAVENRFDDNHSYIEGIYIYMLKNAGLTHGIASDLTHGIASFY